MSEKDCAAFEPLLPACLPYAITIYGTAGGVQRTTTLTLQVNQARVLQNLKVSAVTLDGSAL